MSFYYLSFKIIDKDCCSLQLIGWKPQGEARRIVLLVTDALPKVAGDGQVGCW